MLCFYSNTNELYLQKPFKNKSFVQVLVVEKNVIAQVQSFYYCVTNPPSWAGAGVYIVLVAESAVTAFKTKLASSLG
jgi:hypothetical protein